MKLEDFSRIHMVGITGSGMSGLAGILRARAKAVTGSTNEDGPAVAALQKEGIKVHIGHGALPAGAEAVIHSLAIPKHNPEIMEATRRKIPLLSYPQAVGLLTKEYRTIAVCGTHGKSTVTAMLTKILIDAGFDPTVLVGAMLLELDKKNYRLGKSPLFLLEACEYQRAFSNYSPDIALITTLDPDHLDYYKNFADYISAFAEFTSKLPVDGYLIGNIDDEDVHEILRSAQRKRFPSYNAFTYGTASAAASFCLQENTIVNGAHALGRLRLAIPGAHNRSNALAAFACASLLGASPGQILKSLANFKGAGRRFELVGSVNGAEVRDDYGHHPVEIRATLQAARERFPTGRILLVFQPHQFSRTRALLKDFTHSFADADAVIVPNIYASRDSAKDIAAMPEKKFVAALQKKHKNVRFGEGLEKTTQIAKKEAKKFDLILTMGAGDVWKVARKLTTPSST